MNFSLKPTLEHIALVHVTATLWNEHDIRLLLTEFLKSPLFSKVEFDIFFIPTHLRERKEKWQTIENRVKEKLPQLMIPTTLKEKMLSFIEPIGLQILRWLEYHHKCYPFDLDLPNEFRWTPQGTVDKKKTASLLINDENINITTRYKLACVYCLEHDIQRLWNEIPENHRIFFYDEENPSRIQQEELVVFWTYFIKGEVAKMDRMIKEKYSRRCPSNECAFKWAADAGSSYQYAFNCAAEAGNKEATKYFLQKLTSGKKSLINTAISVARKRYEVKSEYNSSDIPKEYHTDVLRFLLSQMNEEQRIEVFRRQPFQVLKSFLDWPCQNLFLEIARCLWNFLRGVLDYNALLRLLIEKAIIGYTDCNYQEMFGKLWQQIPDTDRSSLISDSSIAGLIYLLLEIKDGKNIKLIFQTVSPMEKKDLIFSMRGRLICEDMIYEDGVDLLQFFIQVCLSSKDEIIKFKQEFQEHILQRYPLGEGRFSGNDKLDVFYKLLDDYFCILDKRKTNGDDNSPAKRLCKS